MYIWTSSSSSASDNRMCEPTELSSPRYKVRPPRPKVVVKPRRKCLTPAQLKTKND